MYPPLKLNPAPRYALADTLIPWTLASAILSRFRTPTLSELYATDIAKKNDRLTIGNLDLKPVEATFPVSSNS